MRKFTALALFLTLMTVSPILAEQEYGRPGEMEAGGIIGYSFLDEYAGLNLKNNLHFGARFGIFVDRNYSFETTYQLLYTDTDLAAGGNRGARIGSWRFNLLYHFLSGSNVRPYLTGGIGWEHTKVYGTLNSQDMGFNAGLGVRYYITDYLVARADGRFVYKEVAGASRQYDCEASFGISYIFGGKPAADADGDGVADKKDQCAATPAGAKVDENGCPMDADKDGVFDGTDKCPRTLQGLKVDEKGCMQDLDGDAVPDGPDQCPDTPKGMKVDSKGCPADRDGDGVADIQDKCPDTKEGIEVDDKGCPLDTDADKVPDYLDHCPNTAPGIKIDSKGCPLVTKSRGILKGITFRFGKAELTPNSKTILNDVTKELLEFPKVRVEVQGHTDSVGSAEANLRVSNARAESVVEYMVSKGVPRDRLTARGYGEIQPVANNKTKAGRSKNRRVELKWLDN